MTRDDIVQSVRGFVGLSIHHDPNGELARLVDFPGGAPPEQEVQIKTNCAMFACGMLRWLGCTHPLLQHEYVNGMAMTWLIEIARDMNALHLPGDRTRPLRGDICHWATPPAPGQKPRNDDHVAFLVTNPNEARMVLRAGGGATDNLITETTFPENYTVDHWRPLRHWIDVVKVLGDIC
jgi:hypothetical protein